jgi:hypothetical protein
MRSLLLVIAFLGLSVAAATPSRAETDADAYCTFASKVATSQSALLYSPQLYLSYGYINGDEGVPGSVSAAASGARLTAGIRYSISESYQGAMTSAHARADCRRYRALSQLNSFLEFSRELESRGALAAKTEVLEAAQPQALEILRVAHAVATDGRATIEQLNATELRVDALRASLAETRQALAVAAQRPRSPTQSIASLQRARESAERAVERIEGRQRRAQGWDLVLRAGYDRLFGIRDHLPLFGTAMVSFNPGWFAQRGADNEALRARLTWSRLDPAGPDQRAQAVLRQYAAIEQEERGRLQESEVLVADLEARWKAVDGIDGPHAHAFRDYVWFDLVRLRAEVAYLKAHLTELETYRGERL